MARQSTAAQRNLSLTEELEKLEQSITLTLQEIDHNFSRAHRIVTTSILPIVEQYADHSKNVWESSKFWKQFFEASANVSLSGYEEQPPDDGGQGEDLDATSVTTPSTPTFNSPSDAQASSVTPTANGRIHHGEDPASPSPSQAATPRAKANKTPNQKSNPTTAPFASPYESLKRDHMPPNEDSTTIEPSTPRAGPIDDPAPGTVRSIQRGQRTPSAGGNDVLLHRVLDKNWRLQTTPHSTARLPLRNKTNQSSPEKRTKSSHKTINEDLDSSPALPAAPELHAEIFDSPARRARPRVSAGAPRVPGVSILHGGGTPRATQQPRSAAKPGKDTTATQILWDSDDDDDDAGYTGRGGEIMSPPKTMSFHVPQARLVKTPAREASKRIVEDILLTANGGRTVDSVEDDKDDEMLGEIRQRTVMEDVNDSSPSLVKGPTGLLEEDTF